MCPVKTENLAVNVPRAEAAFWRRMAVSTNAKSRGDLFKSLLLKSLERCDSIAATELKGIRARHRGLSAAALLVIFCLGAFGHEARAAARTRRGREDCFYGQVQPVAE